MSVTTTPGGLLRWSRLSNPQRFEAYNRWTLAMFLGIVPFLALTLLTGPTPFHGAQVLAYLAVAIAHTVVCVLVASRSFDHTLGRRPLPRRALAALGVSVLTGLVIIAAVYPGIGRAADPQTLLYPVIVLLLSALTSVCPLINAWYVMAAGGLIAALSSLFMVAAGEPAYLPMAVVVSLIVCWSMGLSMRISVWMVLVMWDLDRRRQVDARLAVAEERLRFSRDLHDVFGRTLSTVAVKSELAAALAQRDDPRGREEMLQVRALAEEALKEVRQVVQGYRGADLHTELVGARSILTAAGIEARVGGENLDLPAAAQEALAWVVREAVTNVVRHSQAEACLIELSKDAGGYRVQVRNDGVAPTSDHPAGVVATSAGSGIRGLTERIGALGGTVRARTGPGWFALTAWVPADIDLPVPAAGVAAVEPMDMEQQR